MSTPIPVPTHTLDERQTFKILLDSTLTYLTDKLLVGLPVTLWTDGLLQEGQQNRDNNTRLETFTKANEEHLTVVSNCAVKLHKHRSELQRTRYREDVLGTHCVFA